jgi:hypothetical protein
MLKTTASVLLALSLTIPEKSYALDYEKCIGYAAEAKTEYAYNLVLNLCVVEDSYFFNRSKQFKCAMKAAEAGTEQGAKMVFYSCL